MTKQWIYQTKLIVTLNFRYHIKIEKYKINFPYIKYTHRYVYL